MMKAINEAARNTGSKARNIKPDFKWNSGPLVLVKRQSKKGAYQPGTQILKISKKNVANIYEKNPSEPNEMELEATILHEYVHYLGSGREKLTEEWGAEFEEKLYGVYSPAFKYFNKAWFSFGKWDVKVTGKNSRLQQRFTIKNANTGNGVYRGIKGTRIGGITKKLTGKPCYWRIIIEHKTPRGWQISRVRKRDNWQNVSGNFLIRSEDGADRDFDDLVLVVRRTSTVMP
jgi:hypothetical protein